MKTWTICVAYFIMLSNTVPAATPKALNTINMTDNCNGIVKLNRERGAAFIEFTSSPPSPIPVKCQVILSVSADHQIMFKVLGLNMSDCGNNVSLYGDSTQARDIIARDICESLQSEPFVTPGNTGILSISINTWNNALNIMITDFRMASGNCTSAELKCANNRCIDRSLNCNGFDSCGDGSVCVEKGSEMKASHAEAGFWNDASETNDTSATDSTSVASYMNENFPFLVSPIVVISLIFLVVYCILRRYKKQRRAAAQRQVRNRPLASHTTQRTPQSAALTLTGQPQGHLPQSQTRRQPPSQAYPLQSHPSVCWQAPPPQPYSPQSPGHSGQSPPPQPYSPQSPGHSGQPPPPQAYLPQTHAGSGGLPPRPQGYPPPSHTGFGMQPPPPPGYSPPSHKGYSGQPPPPYDVLPSAPPPPPYESEPPKIPPPAYSEK